MSELRTPSPKRRKSAKARRAIILTSPSKTTNSISGRLEQLAALAWEAEEDDRLDERTRASVLSQLHAIEAQLEGRTRGNEQTSSDVDLSNSVSPNASSASSILEPSISQGTPAQEPRVGPATPAPDLGPILEHLNTTVASMRTRLSESKHLHSLAMSKLSSVAQSNVNLTSQLSAVRKTNTSLSHANAALRMRVDDLESTTSQQAVAVSAMTGAVAGLESYVRSSSPNPHTPRNLHAQMNGQHTPNSGARRQTVVRGSGRFRGKYPISSPPPPVERRESADINMNLDGGGGGGYDLPPSSETRQQSELQEGILGWIRGFRDVEAGWREMDLHRTPTRFGNTIGVQRTPSHTPTRRAKEPDDRAASRSEEDSVLLQGDKVAGSDMFGLDEDFGDFQTITSNG
jgi:hypothetical protein